MGWNYLKPIIIKLNVMKISRKESKEKRSFIIYAVNWYFVWFIMLEFIAVSRYDSVDDSPKYSHNTELQSLSSNEYKWLIDFSLYIH